MSVGGTDESKPRRIQLQEVEEDRTIGKRRAKRRRDVFEEFDHSLLPDIQVNKEDEQLYAKIVDSLCVLGDGSVELRSSTIKEAGLGLFALRSFKKGEPITAYTGLLISHQESIELRDKNMATHVRRHIPLVWNIDGHRLASDGQAITDPIAQMQGLGVAAFTNNQPKGSTIGCANAQFDFVDSPINLDKLKHFFKGATVQLDPTERVTFIRALRNIESGEEIFVNYGKDYWEFCGDGPVSGRL